MSAQRFADSGVLRRGVPATLAATLVAAALTGGGQAAAAVLTAPRASADAAGTISTVAGGPGGPARAGNVALAGPCDVTFAAGHLYIATYPAVRQVSLATDYLTTPAGTGGPSPLSNGGKATRAGLDTCGVAVDHAGNLVIGDLGGNRIQVVAASTGTFYGQHMIAGDLYPVAGDGPPGLA